MKRLVRTWIVLITNLSVILVYKLTLYQAENCFVPKDEASICSTPTVRSSPATPGNTDAPILQPKMLGAPLHGNQTLYLITTTYRKDIQKADLTALCHTLKHIPSLVWIVVENSASKSPVIQALLRRCGVPSVHLTVESPEIVRSTWKYAPKVVGVLHRNTGLRWVRDHCSRESCNGVVYFGDDDDRYDLRFFDEVRKTERASVFMVGLTGGLLMEGPYCENGTVARWHRASGYSREIPVDMQGFAINVRALLEQKDVWMEGVGSYNDLGYPEANRFLSRFATRATLECRTYSNEVLVWRARSTPPVTWNEKYSKSDSSIEF